MMSYKPCRNQSRCNVSFHREGSLADLTCRGVPDPRRGPSIPTSPSLSEFPTRFPTQVTLPRLRAVLVERVYSSGVRVDQDGSSLGLTYVDSVGGEHTDQFDVSQATEHGPLFVELSGGPGAEVGPVRRVEWQAGDTEPSVAIARTMIELLEGKAAGQSSFDDDADEDWTTRY